MYARNTGSAVQNPEPLYLLAEDNKDVSVTNYLMEEHQVDGLRFLFNQFNKKSPGVIVNFPASCGKSATVAIFLNAVANMLKNPILILCKDDGGIQYWKEILLQWSSYVADDIAMEASNPFIKGKKVFLKKRENLYSYLRRRWSIIIIKENAVNKEMFKHSFEADFKICITATDIKKDLQLLTAVYSWLYPQKVINFNDFVTKENRPKEKFRKSVQLDFLLEDVAIRRYINLKPFQINEKAETVKEIETNVTEITTNITEVESHQTDQKFKVTKVKRSKQVNDEEVNEISGQAFILINDHIKNKTSDQNIKSNPLLKNNQLLKHTSDQDIILINDDDDDDDDTLNKISNKHTLGDSSILLDEQSINKTNHNLILVNDQALNESFNQNVIFINNDEILTQTSDQNVIFINNDQISHNDFDNSSNQNAILIDEQFLSKQNQNFILINGQALNETSNQNVIFINDDQILTQTLDRNIVLNNDHILNKISHKGTLNDSVNKNLIFIDEPIISKTNHNFILINEQASNETSNQNVIFINDDQILPQTLDQNIILRNDHILNKISDKGTFNDSVNKNLIFIDEPIISKTDQNIILINDHDVQNETSNQDNFLMHDEHVLNQTSDQNIIFLNHQIVNETSDKNVIFINEQILNGILNLNQFLENDKIVHESFTQNPISIDEKILNEASNENILVMNNQQLNKNSEQSTTLINKKRLNKSSKNSFIINKEKINKSSHQKVILPNDYNKANVKLDDNVIIIDDDDENETNINNYINDVRNPISGDNPPIVNENNDIDIFKIHNFSIDSKYNKLNKINGYKSTIINKNKKMETSIEHTSCKLDVDSFILERKPIDRDDLYHQQKSKITQKFSESLAIENDSKIDLSDMKYLDDKDLLKEQLMVSLDLNLNKIKYIEQSSLKEEHAETESLHFENNPKLDINKIKDLRNQLIESLDLDRVGEVSVNEIKNSENKNTSKFCPNKINDLRNKHLLQKQLFESLGLNSDYQEIPKLVKENNIELNESKDTEDTLIKEESIESLSFGIKSKFYKNNDKCLDTNLIKEESTETLGFSSKSKCDKKDIDILDTNLIKEESKESLSFSSKSKFDKKDMESLDIKEESTESLSFGNKSKFDENHIEDIDTNLIKEESAESLNFGNNSKIELNEMKDLHNRNVLQKQLIESLGLDNVKNEIKDEIKEEATNETSGVVENMHNVVQQIADDLEDNEIVLLKIEQENENVTVSNSNVNIENNKRKSDVIEENLDSKILDLEEKALKKFKGSLLDSLF